VDERHHLGDNKKDAMARTWATQDVDPGCGRARMLRIDWRVIAIAGFASKIIEIIIGQLQKRQSTFIKVDENLQVTSTGLPVSDSDCQSMTKFCRLYETSYTTEELVLII
jgi:hypothetical protein